jgi:hypothetical protein
MNELEESVARELLSRSGISVVWQAHIAAEAAYRSGNERAAELLLKIADAAETICRREGLGSASGIEPLRAPSIETDPHR